MGMGAPACWVLTDAAPLAAAAASGDRRRACGAAGECCPVRSMVAALMLGIVGLPPAWISVMVAVREVDAGAVRAQERRRPAAGGRLGPVPPRPPAKPPRRPRRR